MFLLLLSACSSTTPAVVPAQESSVQYAPPDTVRVGRMPTASLDGRRTRPLRVHVDTEPPPGATSRVESVEVDRTKETVTVRSRTDTTATEQVYRLPAFGERLTLRSDSTLFAGRVQGEPQAERLEVRTEHKRWPRWMIGAIAMLTLLVVLRVLR